LIFKTFDKYRTIPQLVLSYQSDEGNMQDTDTLTDYERILNLETQLKKQEARIEGLISSMALLVMAQVVCNSDARVPARLAEHRDFDLRHVRDGGTKRFDPVFFESRGGLVQDLLNEIRESDFLNKYWIRSMFDWRDEKRRKKIEHIEARLAQYADNQ